jgi:hypothetical protein
VWRSREGLGWWRLSKRGGHLLMPGRWSGVKEGDHGWHPGCGREARNEAEAAREAGQAAGARWSHLLDVPRISRFHPVVGSHQWLSDGESLP